MNKERVLALADLIECQPHVDPLGIDPYLEPSGFNMNCFTHSCGTPSCIAGFAAWEYNGRKINDSDETESKAREYLGLASYFGAKRLFFPTVSGRECASITPQEAAQVLRHLAETGEVDWSIINE